MSYYFSSGGSGKGLAAAYAPTFPVSISLWFYAASAPTTGTYLFSLSRDSGSTGDALIVFGDGIVSAFSATGTAAETGAFATSEWVHIGAVFGTNVTKVYLNGTKTENSTGAPSTTTQVGLFCLYEDLTRYFASVPKYAEVCLWNNTTLSDANFTALAAKDHPDTIGSGPTWRIPLLHTTGYVDAKSVITLADGGSAMTSDAAEPGIDALGTSIPVLLNYYRQLR